MSKDQSKDVYTNEELLVMLEEHGLRMRGHKEFKAHLEGKQVSIGQACKGFCYDCLGWHTGGKTPCTAVNCILYRWCPYKSVPLKSVAKKRVISAETRQKMAEGLKRGRDKRRKGAVVC